MPVLDSRAYSGTIEDAEPSTVVAIARQPISVPSAPLSRGLPQRATISLDNWTRHASRNIVGHCRRASPHFFSG